MKNPPARTNLRGISGRSTGTLPSLIAFGNILLAGADKIGTTMIETREQMIQLSQISPHPGAQSGATTNPFFPVDVLLPQGLAAN